MLHYSSLIPYIISLSMASTPLLLRLPTDVRARIFRETGLIRKCPIGFSQEKIRISRLRKGLFGSRGNHGCCDVNKIRNTFVCDSGYIDDDGLDESPVSGWDPEGESTESSDEHIWVFNFRLSNDNETDLLCVHEPLPIGLLSFAVRYTLKPSIFSTVKMYFILIVRINRPSVALST